MNMAHGAHHRDNNMRAAVVHVMADAAVSVLVIVGLLLARAFGWLWMDPLAGFIGALVIANWSVGLLRDTGGILLDRTPDPRMAEKVRDIDRSRGRPGHRPASLAARARTSRRHRLRRHHGRARSGALPAATGQIRRPVARHRRGPAPPFRNRLNRRLPRHSAVFSVEMRGVARLSQPNAIQHSASLHSFLQLRIICNNAWE